MNLMNWATPLSSAPLWPFITQSVPPPTIVFCFLYGAPQCGSWPVAHSNFSDFLKPPITAEDWISMAQSPLMNFGSGWPMRPP